MEQNQIERILVRYNQLWTERKKIKNIKTRDEIILFIKNYNLLFEDFFNEINLFCKADKEQLISLIKTEHESLKSEDNLFNDISESEMYVFANPDNNLLAGLRKTKLGFSLTSILKITDRVAWLEFDLKKVEGACNCKLKQDLNLSLKEQPNTMLKFIAVVDHYYKSSLFICKECSTYWIHDTYEGTTSVWRKLSQQFEFDMVRNTNGNI